MYLQLFLVVWIFPRSLGLICYHRWVLSEGHELTAYFSAFSLFLTRWIMAILSKGCKPGNFEPYNSLKLSFTNIRNLPSNFVECESFLESNSTDIITLWETHLDDSIDFDYFSVRDFLPLIRKDSITHMHGLAVYVKEGLPFAWDLSLENSEDSYLCFDCLYLTQCLTPSSSSITFFALILFHLT